MIEKRKTMFLLALAVVLSACVPPADTSGPSPEQLAADEEALRRVSSTDWDAASQARDMDAMPALYTDDAVVMPPDEPLVQGKAALRARLESEWAEDEGEEFSSAVTEVVVSGDWGFVRGTWAEVVPEGETGETGNWLVICQRRADGSWGIARETWSEEEEEDDDEGEG